MCRAEINTFRSVYALKVLQDIRNLRVAVQRHRLDVEAQQVVDEQCLLRLLVFQDIFICEIVLIQKFLTKQ